MSAHRQHYLPPAPQQQQKRDCAAALIGLAACAALMIGGGIATMLHAGLPSTATAPVRQAQAAGCPIPPMTAPSAEAGRP